jgi:hypothetical protein
MSAKILLTSALLMTAVNVALAAPLTDAGARPRSLPERRNATECL